MRNIWIPALGLIAVFFGCSPNEGKCGHQYKCASTADRSMSGIDGSGEGTDNSSDSTDQLSQASGNKKDAEETSNSEEQTDSAASEENATPVEQSNSDETLEDPLAGMENTTPGDGDQAKNDTVNDAQPPEDLKPPLMAFNQLQDLVGDNQVSPVATGLQFTEGPVWVDAGYLLFSDIPANKILKWTPNDGLSDFRNPSEKSNGLTLDPNGQLIACEHGGRRVSRAPLDGAKQTVVDSFNGNKFNSPNDCVLHQSGDIYFTDPPYGLEGRAAELDFNGVFKVDANGVVTRLAADINFNRPNGLAFNRDYTALYVADTAEGRIWKFPLAADGTTGAGQMFADVPNPDGIKVDLRDHLYVTSADGVEVFKPDGTSIGIISFPERPANCAFGGDEMDTLYVTARTSVYQIKLNTVGRR